MNLLPTYIFENVFSINEIDEVVSLIKNHGYSLDDDSSLYPDTGKDGRNQGKIIANNIFWDYHQFENIANILTPKLEKIIKKKLIVTEAHLLLSKIPYLIHTDFVHDNKGLTPEYTLLIPIDTYDSYTICFNEWAEEFNDFAIYKLNCKEEPTLRIDPKFCADRLSHLHPNDLKYLTIHETFKWNKGSVFAMDRRYFHCSDNYKKRKIDGKNAIVLWTLS
jgi:hypothetical protein